MQAAGLATLTWRAIAGSDVVAWAALLEAAEAIDQLGEHYSADDLAEELADPALDIAADTIAAFDGERMVGYAVVRAGSAAFDNVYRVNADGCVHPDLRRRGLGADLIERSAVRAAKLHALHAPRQRAELVVYANDRRSGVQALMDSAGLRPVRWWYEMDRDLSGPVEATPVPGGLRLATWEPAIDERLRVAHNEAFAAHWGSAERDPAFWRQWFSGARAFRPADSLLLWDGDQIAGYLLVYEYEAETAATGVREAWIGQVGTRPPWRGRGVASTLLTHALANCRAHGYRRCALGVDSGNATGALGLYQRVGFVVTERATSFSRPIG